MKRKFLDQGFIENRHVYLEQATKEGALALAKSHAEPGDIVQFSHWALVEANMPWSSVAEWRDGSMSRKHGF